MKIIKKMICKIVRWANSAEEGKTVKDGWSTSPNIISGGNRSKSQSLQESSRGLNFTVYSAIGGKIIQTSSYDPTMDRYTGDLYIITDREDLGEELSQIITKENLSR